MTGQQTLPNEVLLNVLDYFTAEWTRVREPLYESYPVAVSGYVQATKRQLYTLSRVNRYFRCSLLPHIFHTIVFRGSHFIFDPQPNDYRQFCTELLEGQPRAVAIAAVVKRCIFVTWNPGIIGEEAFQENSQRLKTQMERDLSAVELMPNLRTLRINNSVVPFTFLAKTLSKLVSPLEAFCLGELQPSHEPGPLIQAISRSPALTDLTLHEINLIYFDQISLPNIHTLRIPFLRDLPFARIFFRILPFLPSLKALHIHSHMADLSSLLPAVNPPSLVLEHLTCPLELAPILVPGQPLRTAALRVPHMFENTRFSDAVAALQTISGELKELEIPHSICFMDKWLSKIPVSHLRKLVITVLALPTAGSEDVYDRIWRQFEREPLAELESFEIHVLGHQLDFTFQRDLISRLSVPFPRLDHACFSDYLEWHRRLDGSWTCVKLIDPGEPMSWFRDHSRGGAEYVMSILNTQEFLMGDERGLFAKENRWPAVNASTLGYL